MKDVILVGISWQKNLSSDTREHVSRFRDYSIRMSSNPEHQAKYQFGQAKDHLVFIHNHVIKYVENNFRTDPDRRTYFGYSLGGVFGAYILLVKPNTFKNYILGSPSLDGNIPFLAELESKENLNANVFISYGALEKDLGTHVEAYISILKSRNDDSLFLQKEVIESADHGSAFPTTAVRSVRWLSNLQTERRK